jgi:hypothetical protein
MKRFVVGSCAVVVAVLLVAFTTPKKAKYENYYFEYTLSTFTEAQVENPANWVQVSDLGLCNNVNSKACRILVGPASVIWNGLKWVLKNTCTIISIQGPNFHFHVQLGGCVLDKKNKDG